MNFIAIWEKITSEVIIDNLLASLIFLIAQTLFITIGVGLLFRWQNNRRNKPIVDIFLNRLTSANQTISATLSSACENRDQITQHFHQQAVYHIPRLKEIVTLQTTALSSFAISAYEYIADCEYMLVMFQHIMHAKQHPNELVYLEVPYARFERMINLQNATLKSQEDNRNTYQNLEKALDSIQKLSTNYPNIINDLEDDRVKLYTSLNVLDVNTAQKLSIPEHINSIRTTVGYAA